MITELKDNKPLLIVIIILGILALGYIGVNLQMASFVGDTTTYARGHIKLSEYKQDGSRNMEVVMGEPHILEFWIDPYGTGSLYEYMFIYPCSNRAESYQVRIYPTGYSPGYFSIPITSVNTLGPWCIEYWERGSIRASETYTMTRTDGVDVPFTFTVYDKTREDDFCQDTTLYNNGTYFMGDMFFNEYINSPECGYVHPCEGVFCVDYCDNTTSYRNGTCEDGECIYDITPNSTDCGYIAPEPTSTPTPTATPTEEPNLFDPITDLFEPAPSTPVPTPTPAPVEEEVVTPEPTNMLDDLMEWLQELIEEIL